MHCTRPSEQVGWPPSTNTSPFAVAMPCLQGTAQAQGAQVDGEAAAWSPMSCSCAPACSQQGEEASHVGENGLGWG